MLEDIDRHLYFVVDSAGKRYPVDNQLRLYGAPPGSVVMNYRHVTNKFVAHENDNHMSWVEDKRPTLEVSALHFNEMSKQVKLFIWYTLMKTV